MGKILISLGIVLGSLLGLVVIASIGVSIRANSRLNATYNIQPEVVVIPTDPASVEDGKRLAAIYCSGCHGENMAGMDFFNDPALATVDAPNLTAGTGGIGSQYSYADWVRAIRHGVDNHGKPLFIMPSKDFYYFSDEDLGQLIAYLKSTPPVDHDANDFSITFVGRILLGVGALGDVFNVESIDHTGPRPAAPLPAVSVAYGDYLVKTFGCRSCHGEQLAGGVGPDPGSPPGPNLTPGGNLGAWSEQDFIKIVRTLKSEWMPYESLSKMNDDELRAIFLYLQSLPKLETNTK